MSNNERKRKWERLEKKRKGEKKRKKIKKIKVKWCGDFDFLYLRNQKSYCVLRNQLAAVN